MKYTQNEISAHIHRKTWNKNGNEVNHGNVHE